MTDQPAPPPDDAPAAPEERRPFAVPEDLLIHLPPAPSTLQTFFWDPRIGVGAVLILAIGGPVVASFLVWLQDPGLPWWGNLLASMGGGWFAPLMIVVLMGVFQARNEIVSRRAARFLAESTSLMIGIAASRARYYASVDEPDPWDKAVYDVGNYLNERVPPDVRRAWKTEAYRWYATHPAAADLPAPITPDNIRKLRNRR